MTFNEAKDVFLNRGYVEVEGGQIFDGDKWRQCIVVISEWLKQEPFINKPCVSEGVCREDNIQVLDKIRAEIEQIAKDYDKFNDYRRVRGLWIALEIIDKYKAESEDKE